MNDSVSTSILQGPNIAIMARRVLLVQLVLAVLVSLVFWAIGTWTALISGLLGAACAIVPNVVFFGLLARTDTDSPQAFLRAFRRGESLKMVFTFLMFALILILRWPQLQALPLFICFAAVLLAHWVSLLPQLKSEVPHGS